MGPVSTSDVLRGRHKRSSDEGRHECEDYFYYDTAIPECTPCDHLCDNHEVQRTTDQCKNKCFKYYQRMLTPSSTYTTASPTAVTSTFETRPVHATGKARPFHDDKGDAILSVVIVLLALAVGAAVGYVVWKKIRKTRCRRRRREEVKTSVPCSDEDGINSVGDSKKPLMGSSGPIRQAESCPQQEIADVKIPLDGSPPCTYPQTFAEFGGARYAVLDAPLSHVRHSTIPKEVSDDSGDTYISHSTVPKEMYGEEFSDSDIRTNSPTDELTEQSLNNCKLDGTTA